MPRYQEWALQRRSVHRLQLFLLHLPTSPAVGKAKLNRLLHCPEGLEVCYAHAAQSNGGKDTKTETGQGGNGRVSSDLLGCALQELLVLLAQAVVR